MNPTAVRNSLARSSKRFIQTVQQQPISSVSPMVFKTPMQSGKSSTADMLSQSKPWTTYSLPTSRPLVKTTPLKTTEPIKTPEPKKAVKQKRSLRPRKAVISLTSNAVLHLKSLLDGPTPKLIRISVKNRGCSGLTYHLDYVDKAEKFDEEVTQDGVKVLIDSKALFSIIGSQMDWKEDKLSSKFVFSNPNIKGECGCGESFMV